MPHATRRTMMEPSPAGSLFKADRPRAIDRHIDFFGNEGAAGPDMCGEALLDALTVPAPVEDEDAVHSCA